MKQTLRLCKEVSPKRATLRPVYTHRVHIVPPMKGHRQWISGKQEWRRP
jgi:hypothetical protein